MTIFIEDPAKVGVLTAEQHGGEKDGAPIFCLQTGFEDNPFFRTRITMTRDVAIALRDLLSLCIDRTIPVPPLEIEGAS